MDDGRSARRHDPDDQLFIIGLVGRAGSGKSSAAAALVEVGARLIDGDRLGHEVTDGDPLVRSRLAEEYGEDVYDSDGKLDRQRVAAKVFRDPLARGRLDRLVHPRIMERIMAALERLRAEAFAGVVVIDAALMLEWGLERWCDAVIAVTATEAEQIGRLRRSRGWSDEEAARRLRVQRTNEAFAEMADLTIENDGNLDELKRAVLTAVARLAEPHAARVPIPWKERC